MSTVPHMRLTILILLIPSIVYNLFFTPITSGLPILNRWI